MRFALVHLAYEYRRFLPGVLAVAVSTVVVALQVGIMVGLVGLVSLPVDLSGADVWVTSPAAPSVDLGGQIGRQWENRLRAHPGVAQTDEVIQVFGFWKGAGTGSVLVVVLGVNLADGALGPGARLPPGLRALLSERGAVLVDRSDRARLGVTAVGQTAEVYGSRVRVAGFLEGLGSVTGPYLVCSLQTARQVLNMPEDTTTFVLVRCHRPADVPGVLAEVPTGRQVSLRAAADFSRGSRLYWLRTTRAGLAVAFIAALGLAVGVVVTSQSLYAATAGAARELALLRALGAPRWRLRRFVLQQAVAVGVAGLLVGVPAAFGLAWAARSVGAQAVLPPWLLGGTAALALGVALLGGLVALRSLRQTDPVRLLR